MKRFTASVALLSLICFALPAAAQMDRAEMAFNFMFGKAIAEAAATESLVDDAKLAQTFLDGLERPGLAQELRARIVEKAYEYGIKHPEGYEAAAKSIELQEAAAPLEAARFDGMRLTLEELRFENLKRADRDPDGMFDMYQAFGAARLAERDPAGAKQFFERGLAFADQHLLRRKAEAEKSLARAQKLGQVLADIDKAKAALATNPEDAAAAETLLELVGLELDSPGEAIAAVPALKDSQLHEILSLASSPLAEMTEDAALRLGKWYTQRAALPGTGLREESMIRAKLYYSEYLLKHPTEDEARLAAKHELRQLDDQLAMLGISRKVARKRVEKLAGGGRGHRDPKVDAAIEKGVAWLYQQMDPEELWEKQTQHNQSRNFGGHTAIAVYALLMAEEEPRTTPELARAIRWLFAAELSGTYAVCFRMHAWELLPDRERYRKVMLGDTVWLRTAQTAEGYYEYTMADSKKQSRRDISVTLAGALGLWLADEVAQIEIAPQHWQRLAQACLNGQQVDGGWSYLGNEQQVSYGSMTAAGLTCLLVSREHLPEQMHEKADKAIASGMEWLNYQFTPDRNPIKPGWTYYYLAAVQHVGLLTGQREFNKLDWYQSGSEYILRSQKDDGSWGNVSETSFAIAFLTRGGVAYGSEGAEMVTKTDPP